MHKEFLFLVCIFATAVEVYNKPTYKSGIRQCFKHDCPENTYACEKFSHVSQEDRTKIEEDIRCLNLQGVSLKNITNYEKNPYGPDVEFKSYRYTGAFRVTVDDDSTENTEGFDNSHKENTNFGRDKNRESEIEDLA